MEIVWTYGKAFLVGGALCVIGQLLIDMTRLTPARILTSYVVAGVILGGLGLYGPLADWAGAGATVPLTGFGWALAKGVERAVAEKGLLGVFSGGFTAASAGLCAAVFFGFLIALIGRPRDKNGRS
ncbi:MAG: stage V sporulation protein AE [Oscillospiraceae bacterium]|nr:stage V sporulation protein AE [Oscillospiraceae bacterium]